MGADLAFAGIVGVIITKEDLFVKEEAWNCEHDVARPPALHCATCGKKVGKKNKWPIREELKDVLDPKEWDTNAADDFRMRDITCMDAKICGLDVIELGDDGDGPYAIGKAFPHKWGDNEILHEYTTEELIDMENEVLEGLEKLNIGAREVKVYMRTYWSI